MRLDWNTRQRALELIDLPDSQDLGALVDILNDRFLSALERQPELWFYWPAPQGFFLFPEGARLD